jgi:glycosyltransferase involved in cell wall biosynthesis
MSAGKRHRTGPTLSNGEETDDPGTKLSGDELLLSAESDQTPTISVVMPTLNEEDGVGDCIERVKGALEQLQVTGEVVVSDSSTDRTPDVARERGAIVVEPDQPGYGYAYRYAFERTRGDYVAMGDADTTYDFGELPKLYRHVAEGRADIAMGSRLDGEIKDGAMPPLHEHVGNPLLTRFLNAFYDAGVSDAHSGMRVFSRDALDRMDLSTNGMEFASEMIMEAGARDLTIAEEPITYHEREGEATLDSFEDGWRHVRFMLVNAPGYLFAIPGIVMTAVGVAITALAMFNVGLGGTSFGVHSMLVGSLGTLVGTQVVGLGVFTTVASDPIRSPSDPITNAIVDHLTLERGVLAGAVVFGLGFLSASRCSPSGPRAGSPRSRS